MKFPKTVAAVKAEEMSGWKLADAILAECPGGDLNPPIKPRLDAMHDDIEAECFKSIPTSTLKRYRTAAQKFPRQARLADYPMATHIAAGSIENLQALIAGRKAVGVGKKRRTITPIVARTVVHAHKKAAKAKGEKPGPITETIAAELVRATDLMGDLARVSELSRKLDGDITQEVAGEFSDDMVGGYLEMIEESITALRSVSSKLKHGRKRAHLTVVA